MIAAQANKESQVNGIVSTFVQTGRHKLRSHRPSVSISSCSYGGWGGGQNNNRYTCMGKKDVGGEGVEEKEGQRKRQIVKGHRDLCFSSHISLQ